ncbi:ABC transporter permease [Granulosicoccus sp. 3-233]|uniref:ABC transporter permease n=1 Tax=Granulosicoccus sp. 3-233 TaxID=3417969 RepID=UPI003D357283
MNRSTTLGRARIPGLFVSLALMLLAWQLLVMLSGIPHFLLPAPFAILKTLFSQMQTLGLHTAITAFEVIAGLLSGCVLGILSAILLTTSRRLRRWLLPLMVISQSLPVFALAPLLTLWFGYGMGSKVVMAILIIYFPVVAATFDGLRHTSSAMLDLARTMNATPTTILLQIRLPAALPSMASGIRVATSVAPIGAVVGEWVGSSQGLGYLMLQANGRMQTDLMFAALLCLCLMAFLLYSLVNHLLDRCLYWLPDSSRNNALQTETH